MSRVWKYPLTVGKTTRHEMPDGAYVGSMHSSPFVWHVYEVAT